MPSPPLLPIGTEKVIEFFPSEQKRTPLTGILQLQHMKDFCKLLVEVSTEAAKTISGPQPVVKEKTSASSSVVPH
ncbi:hypothetical protein ACS0TY_006603 [Phlomoides rotata]